MHHPIGDWQAQLRHGVRTRRPRARRPALEALEERALLSAAPHGGDHRHEAGRHEEAVSAYQQTNLVSDLSSEGAQVVDPNLKNPWGVAFSAAGPFWIANTGSSTVSIDTVSPKGGVVTQSSLVETLPSGEHPTGQAFNTTASATGAELQDPRSGQHDRARRVPLRHRGGHHRRLESQLGRRSESRRDRG